MMLIVELISTIHGGYWISSLAGYINMLEIIRLHCFDTQLLVGNISRVKLSQMTIDS